MSLTTCACCHPPCKLIECEEACTGDPWQQPVCIAIIDMSLAVGFSFTSDTDDIERQCCCKASMLAILMVCAHFIAGCDMALAFGEDVPDLNLHPFASKSSESYGHNRKVA